MDASSLTLPVAVQRIRVEGGFSNERDTWEMCLHTRYPASITWEECVANQAQLRVKSLKYREEQPGVARKELCAVGAVEPSSTCTIRASRGNGPSIGVVPIKASLEAQTANACVHWL
jgi:hypothetical protein